MQFGFSPYFNFCQWIISTLPKKFVQDVMKALTFFNLCQNHLILRRICMSPLAQYSEGVHRLASVQRRYKHVEQALYFHKRSIY